MKDHLILVIDEGTTSTRVNIFDSDGSIVATSGKEFTQIFPRPSWVEHDPVEIWRATLKCISEAIGSSSINPRQIAAIGVTNQRETTVVWDRDTSQPIYNAIVWQCRRTAPFCQNLKELGYEEEIRQRTGLVLDAYFSATKIRWILDNIPGARRKAENGELLFGTIDSWLIWNLTGGSVHATDHTNASRTMIFNIHTVNWDEEILRLMDLPPTMLPETRPSQAHYGITRGLGVLPDGIPILAACGDQQAALFGQGCFDRGTAKNTYGTGCFMLMNTGGKAFSSQHGLITTIGISTRKEIMYALEGSIFMAGALVQWLRDSVGIIANSQDTEALALGLPDNGGVYFVPAFAGLGAPHWDMYARGTLIGLTRAAGKAHIVRAALESIAYQTWDVLLAMEKDSEITLSQLKVDGGAAANNFLMQFQADILGVDVIRPKNIESTSQGTAYLAGLEAGIWSSLDEVRSLNAIDKIFTPSMPQDKKSEYCWGWQEAVKCARDWERKRIPPRETVLR